MGTTGDLLRTPTRVSTALQEREPFALTGAAQSTRAVVRFGGGFRDADGTAFGEREMKAFVNRSAEDAGALKHTLHALDADLRVVLTHYSPIPGTLQGEPRETHPFLGSRLLADAVDSGSRAWRCTGTPTAVPPTGPRREGCRCTTLPSP